jgi:two-component system sensor histidine kinase PhoQ
MRSLRARILVSAAAVLTLFVLLTGLALEQAFRDSARSAREERLLGQLYLLMAAAEAEEGTLLLPAVLAEPRFSLPASGLYAAVMDATGTRIWRSSSTVGVRPPLEGALPPGQRRFELSQDTSGRDYFVHRFAVTWATGPDPVAYTFAVAEDLAPYRAELARFRASLAGWLGGMALLMLAALLLVLRWGLAPLRRVAAEVAAVESAEQPRIRGDYPAELHALTGNLNALLAHERAQQKRLGNALGDLAHSLKTPLAVMQGIVDEQRDPDRAKPLEEQIKRMNHIVEYQLQRARSRAGIAAGLAPPVPLRRLTERITDSLEKVYEGKGIQTTLMVDSDLKLRVAEGDLMELLGNLLDNAYKWARCDVRVTAVGYDGSLELTVEDDGPGIAPERATRLLERGTRGDESVAGHGIGLAVAKEICEAYGGGLRIEASDLGGALVRVHIGD